MQKENLAQLEKILNECIEKGWKPKTLPVNYTLNDLLFGESGFMESLEWKKGIRYEWFLCGNIGKFETSEMIKGHDNTEIEYHKIQLVLLQTDEERVEYLLNNIVSG